jgi:hypothetical protein
MTEWVLNRVEWEALKFTPRSLFTGVRGRRILRSPYAGSCIVRLEQSSLRRLALILPIGLTTTPCVDE